MGFFSFFGRSGYAGATPSRARQNRAETRAAPVSEEGLLFPADRERLTLSIQDQARNNGLVHAILDRLADLVVASGITVQARTSSPDWNASSEAWFENWGKICDSRRRQQFWQMQRQTIRDLLVAGEAFFVLRSNLQIQPVEAARVVTPVEFDGDDQVIQGIRIGGPDEIAVGYYICPRDRNGYVDRTKYTYINADNIVHVCDPWRVDQLRGVAGLASIATYLQDRHEITEATLTRAKIDAKVTLVINKNGDKAGPGSWGFRDVPQASDQPKIDKMADGMCITMDKGDVKSLMSNTPNGTFAAFNDLNMREIAAAISLPVELLMLSVGTTMPKQSVALAQRTIARYQKILSAQFIGRVWNWAVAKAANEGLIERAPLDANDVSEWNKISLSFPGYDWADGSEEASNLTAWNMGTRSLSEIARRAGREFEDTLSEKVGEIEYAIQQAKALNAKHGANVSWRELIQTSDPGQWNTEQTKQQATETAPKKEQQ